MNIDPLKINKFVSILFFVSIYLLIDFIIYQRLYLITVGISFALIIIFLIIPRFGFMLFIPLMMLSDYTTRLDRLATADMASIHNIYFGPFNLMTYVVLFMGFYTSMVIILKNKDGYINKTTLQLILLLGAAYGISLLIGLKNIFQYPRQYIADAAPFINISIAFIITKSYFSEKEHIERLLWILFYTFCARALVGISMMVLGVGTTKYYLFDPFLDPVGAFPIFGIILSLSFLFFDKKRNSEKHTYYFIIMLFLSFMILSPGRATWIFLGLGILYLSVFMKLKNKIIIFTKVTIAIAILIFVLSNFMPKTVNYTMGRLLTLRMLSQGIEGPATTSQRIAEYVNIYYKLKDEGILLWGSGAGGWFNDEYLIFPARLNPPFNSFTSKEIEQNRFFHPHGWLANVILKSGLLGLCFYLSFFFILNLKMKRFIKYRINCNEKAVLIGLFIPFVYQIVGGYVSKNYITAGVLLGIFINVLEGVKKNRTVAIYQCLYSDSVQPKKAL